MKRLISIALFTIAVAAVSCAQTSITPGMQNAPARKSPLAEYAGAWAGSFEGHVWMSIRLNLQNNQITGSVLRPQKVEFNDDGGLKGISDEKVTETIENAQLNGDGLLLTAKDAQTQETNRYVMRLTTANTAEVKMVAMSMPPGMAKPKPWVLNRVGPSAVTPTR